MDKIVMKTIQNIFSFFFMREIFFQRYRNFSFLEHKHSIDLKDPPKKDR